MMFFTLRIFTFAYLTRSQIYDKIFTSVIGVFAQHTTFFNTIYEVNTMSEINNSIGPIENPELIAAIEALKEDHNDINRENMAKAVKKAVFIIPSRIAEKPSKDEEGQKINFLMLNNNGKIYLPLFSDHKEFEKLEHHETLQCAALTLPHIVRFLNIMHGSNNVSGVVIDPYGHNVTIPMELLLKIHNTDVVSKGTKVHVFDPTEMPEELIEAVMPYLKEHTDIEKAYLRLMKREDQERAGLLLILDVDTKKLGDAASRELFGGVVEIVRPYLASAEFSVIPANSDFGIQAVGKAEPFYVK